MSAELNTAFVKDPIAFASKTPVVSDPAKGKQFKDMTEDFKGVPGALRIVAGDLVSCGSYVQLNVAYNAVDDQLKKGWMAMYYLPWLEDKIIRTTLRPRSEKNREDQLKTGTRAVVKLTGENGFQKDPNDPDVFFTASVDGCMIVVEGSPNQPTVYHANQKNLKTDTETGAPNDERVGAMISGVKTFGSKFVKNPRGFATDPRKPTGATAAMYMPLDRKATMVGKDVIIPEKEKRRIVKSMGTIFGIRRDSTWHFYYERLLRFQQSTWKNCEFVDPEDEEKTIFRMDWDYTGQTGYALDRDIEEFWPEGKGHVVS